MTSVTNYECQGVDGVRHQRHFWHYKQLSETLAARTCFHCGLRIESPLENFDRLDYQVAGLLSTIEGDPSRRHPETMLPYARLVRQLIYDYESEDAGSGATIDDLLEEA